MGQIAEFFTNKFNNFKPDMFIWIILLFGLMPLTFLLGIMVLDWDKKDFLSKMERVKFYQGATTLALFTIAAYSILVFLFGFRPAIGPYCINNILFFVIAGTSLGLALISLLLMFVVEGWYMNQLNSPSSKYNTEKKYRK